MTLSFSIVEELSDADHCYRVFSPESNPEWLTSLATEYIRLRTKSNCPQPLSDISLEGIGVLSVGRLRQRLKAAVIPVYDPSPLNVVRSDFGEVLSYMLLEREYGTKFGYKSVSDRELVNLPGRGIAIPDGTYSKRLT